MFIFENLKKIKYISSKALNTHSPIKEKHVRCNQSPLMNKQLRKTFMIRTRLLNIGKIIVPEISLPIKDREIFVLSF